MPRLFANSFPRPSLCSALQPGWQPLGCRIPDSRVERNTNAACCCYFAEGVGIIVMHNLSKRPKTSHVGSGGAAAAVPTPSPVVNNRSQGSTAQTKKKNAGTGKGMHWSQKELDLMFDIVSQIKPTGKIVAFSFILIH